MAAFAYFDKSPGQVFLRTDFGEILATQRAGWDAPRSLTPSRLITALRKDGKLHEIRLALSRTSEPLPAKPSPGRETYLTRFAWGETSPYAVGVSLRSGAYLSHSSAVFLHGLTQELPKTIYVNKEQSPKASRPSHLVQDALDRAFKNRQRVSTYTFTYDKYRFVLLSGKNTNRLEVSEIALDNGFQVAVTKLERTLIDITVRPVYGGGIFEVAKAFAAAKDRLSVATLIATLKKLDYVYPYHQAIGYYMERAGFGRSQFERLRALGLKYDFYLANGIVAPRFIPEWRLWIPNDF